MKCFILGWLRLSQSLLHFTRISSSLTQLLQSIMVNHCISSDLKHAALCMRDKGYTVPKICEITNISVPTFYRAQKQQRETGIAMRKKAIRAGRPWLLAQADAKFLLALAQHKPCMFLDKYSKQLKDKRYLKVSLTTIHNTFRCDGTSIKAAQKLASECSPEIRANFVCQISQYQIKNLVFLDGVLKDD